MAWVVIRRGMKGFVKCVVEKGCFNSLTFYHPISSIDCLLEASKDAARKQMEVIGSPHIVYGAKIYDENKQLREVRFYSEPMSEKRFSEFVEEMKDAEIYEIRPSDVQEV